MVKLIFSSPELIFVFLFSIEEGGGGKMMAREAPQVAYSSSQKDFEDLEGAAVVACQEVEGEGGSFGSSVAKRL